MTNLRFTLSERDSKLIAFVYETKEGVLRSCREETRVRKSIVLPTQEVSENLIAGVQYECDLRKMKGGSRGYVAISASPVQYSATVTPIIVKGALYRINVEWNNQRVLFDPFEGRRASVTSRERIAAYLLQRVDIQNVAEIVSIFMRESAIVESKMKADGYYK